MHARRIASVYALLALALALPAETNHQKAVRFVGLLRQRLLYSRDVAKAKFNSGAPVEDLKREKSLIDKALKEAGNDREVAQKILKDQIEASKVAQRNFLAKWARHPKFTDAPDLAKQIRPKLDRVTSQILHHIHEASLLPPSDLKKATAEVTWPKQDRECYSAAWKVATDHLSKN